MVLFQTPPMVFVFYQKKEKKKSDARDIKKFITQVLQTNAI